MLLRRPLHNICEIRTTILIANIFGSLLHKLFMYLALFVWHMQNSKQSCKETTHVQMDKEDGPQHARSVVNQGKAMKRICPKPLSIPPKNIITSNLSWGLMCIVCTTYYLNDINWCLQIPAYQNGLQIILCLLESWYSSLSLPVFHCKHNKEEENTLTLQCTATPGTQICLYATDRKKTTTTTTTKSTTFLAHINTLFLLHFSVIYNLSKVVFTLTQSSLPWVNSLCMTCWVWFSGQWQQFLIPICLGTHN